MVTVTKLKLDDLRSAPVRDGKHFQSITCTGTLLQLEWPVLNWAFRDKVSGISVWLMEKTCGLQNQMAIENTPWLFGCP